MEVQTPRQVRRERRLQSIRAAALELVVSDGIEGFSVHKLADRVDLTAGALYRYFESRDEMLLAVQVEVLTVFDRYFEIVLAQVANTPVLERIVYALRAYVALAELQPQRFQLNAQFVASPRPVFDETAVKTTAERTLKMLGRLGELLEQAETEGHLREGHAARRAVVGWSSVHGLVERRKLDRLSAEVFAPKELMDELLLTMLVGWGASLKAAQVVIEKPVVMEEFQAAMTAAQANDNEVD